MKKLKEKKTALVAESAKTAKKEIAIDINRFRVGSDMTITDVSRMAGLERSQVSAIERASSNYTIDSLLKVVDVLNCNFKIEPKILK